jgi:DNA-binding response OmpR family regulator
MSLRVLIADDEPDVVALVSYAVRLLWPDSIIVAVPDGASALRQSAEAMPDLVILDVQMPAPDGFAVCERLRAVSTVPILMLTVRGATLDKARAFDLGADDYLTKPFDHLELLGRLRALVRRAGLSTGAATVAPPAPLRVAGLTLDPLTHEVRLDGHTVALTATEYRLLEELMRHAGRVLPYSYLLSQVWGPEYAGDLATLRVFVGRLRTKLGNDGEVARYIHTERNIGYRLVAPHRPAEA